LLDSEQAGPGLDAVTAEQNELNECNQIHQTIPAHRQRPDGESDRIELRVKKHRKRRVG